LGDKDQHFHWLNTAYQEHEKALMDLKTDYSLDPLRSDPTCCAESGCRNCNSQDFTLHASLGAAVMSSYTTPGEQQYHPSAEAFP
jgi:hypothetical protein